MGLLGSALGSAFGGLLGGAVGKLAGREDVGRNVGREIGGAGGSLIPWFNQGGAVHRTGAAVVHKGEYILPKGVKPTKAQREAVNKKKANARKGRK